MPRSPRMPTISRWLRSPADLFFKPEDERIYAAVRIVFAAVALLNLLLLWPDRQVFFSNEGLVDLDAAMGDAKPFYLSIFGLLGSEAAVTSVMFVTAFALVMLMAGIGARLAAFWVLVWHISYMARAPLPLAGWDLVLRCFSFLVLISPMGKYWTLPALIRGHAGMIPASVSRHGLILMRLQVVVLYWHAVLARILNPDPYWGNGEFLSYFMLSHHARWPGRWVLEYGSFLAVVTYAIQLAEAAIPVLLLVKKTRWWGALLGTALHIGICLVARDLGLFCLAMLMTYTAFLRHEDVAGAEQWVRRRWRRGASA